MGAVERVGTDVVEKRARRHLAPITRIARSHGLVVERTRPWVEDVFARSVRFKHDYDIPEWGVPTPGFTSKKPYVTFGLSDESADLELAYVGWHSGALGGPIDRVALVTPYGFLDAYDTELSRGGWYYDFSKAYAAKRSEDSFAGTGRSFSALITDFREFIGSEGLDRVVATAFDTYVHARGSGAPPPVRPEQFVSSSERVRRAS